jgi:glycosyltransferase involved in cell wall biosynthesis
MKVCVVDPSLFTLPYDRHLCSGLHSAGVDITLCGRHLRAGESATSDAFPVEARWYPWTERGHRGSARAGRAWMKATEHLWTSVRAATWLRRFDVVHFQWSPMPLADRWLWRRLARARTVIFTVHDTTPFLGRPTSRWQQLGWQKLLHEPHGLIVHTEESKRDLLRCGVAPERVTVIPHGLLHAGGASPAPHAPRAARSSSAPRTMLVFGEIKPYKGIDVLLRALARLPEDVAAGWRLVIAGRPRCDVTELRRLASLSRVPVEWRLEHVPESEIPSLFTSADLMVFPYRQIAASGALMLSLPFGVPVVASQVGIFRELLEPDVTGVLCPPDDDGALATALTRVMRDDALRARLRKNILERAEHVWSWPDIARRHVELYRRYARSAVRAVAPSSETKLEKQTAAAALPDA